jgi:hypothetical protein
MIQGVQRHRLGWLPALPLAAAGSAAAHALAYRIAEPDPRVRAELLEGTGHGYSALLAPFLGGCLALLVAVLAAHFLAGFRNRRAPSLPGWPAALVPLVAFVVQEHVERLAAWGALPLSVVTEPTFAIGLALQLPFALLALLVAHALARVARTLGRALAVAAPERVPWPAAGRPLADGIFFFRRPALALGHAGRAPPA